MTAAPATPAGFGHNQPPKEEQLRDEILARHAHLEPRTKHLEEQLGNLPEVITEDELGPWTDFAKSLRSHLKSLDGAREIEKEPFMRASQLVDGIFKTTMEPLKKGLDTLKERLGIAADKKAARVKAEAAEKARLARLEEERKQREAEAEAQRLREEAAERARVAAEAQRKRDEERLRLQREEEERQRKAREDEERLEKERAAAAERTRLAQEAAAEAGRKRDKELREAKAAEERLALEAKQAKQREEDAAAEAKRQALITERENKRKAEEAEREKKEAERDAARADKALEKQETRVAAAEAKEIKAENMETSKASASRGEYGALSLNKEIWVHANVDVATLDLEALRHHIPVDAYDQAIRSAIKTGVREIRGVHIYLDTQTNIR